MKSKVITDNYVKDYKFHDSALEELTEQDISSANSML